MWMEIIAREGRRPEVGLGAETHRESQEELEEHMHTREALSGAEKQVI